MEQMEVDGEDGVTTTGTQDKSQQDTAGGPWMLDYIDLENFKSYAGKVRVGPFKEHKPFMFSAVIGPNGCGKSNFMDAVSFVTGERSSSLRVKRLNELIHGAAVGKPVSSTARVTAVFKGSGNEVKEFSRVIRGSSSEFVYNGAVVSQQVYLQELKAIGINSKGKNFLVFQGAIESIAMKDSKERTALLEEVCGSAALKEQYDAAKAEMAEADRKAEAAFLKKKGIFNERKCVKIEMNEATAYQKLIKEMEDQEQQLQLFRLFYLDNDIDHLASEKILKNRDLRGYQQLKRNDETELTSLRRERGELNRALAEKEGAFQKKEKERERKIPQEKLIAVQHKVKHLERKLENAEKSLKKANDNKDAQLEDLKVLQRNLEEALKREKELLQGHETTQSQLEESLDVSFQGNQISEYWELKKKVVLETTKEEKAKADLERKRKDKDELYSSLNKQKKDLDLQIEIKKNDLEVTKKFAAKAIETVRGLENQIKTQEDEMRPHKESVTEAERRRKTLEDEYASVCHELQSMKLDRFEVNQKRKKAEVLEALSQRFNGVINRVRDLCKPRHVRYKVAITKIIGGLMDAIVVDKESTARQCIQYMKEQMIEKETFLPLDFLEVQQVKNRLRGRDDIHLAVDLLEYDKKVELAILHCTRNTVVCETTELAFQVSNGSIFNGERVAAVSLEGTLVSPSGIISGGQADLERKARSWNDDDISKKDERKAKLAAEIRETMKTLRRRMDVEGMEQDIEALKSRLKYANEYLKKYVKTAKELEKQIKDLEKESKDVLSRWSAAEAAVNELVESINGIQKEINSKEDKTFATFCEQVGIPNIRVYEDRDVRELEEFKQKRVDAQNEIERLRATISYENESKKSLDENILRWKKTVADIQKSIKESREEEQRMMKDAAVFEEEMTTIREDIDETKKTIEEKEKELKKVMHKISNLDKALLKAQRTVSNIEARLMQKKSEKADLLKKCRLDCVPIPLRLQPNSSDEVPDTQPEPSPVSLLDYACEEYAGREDEFIIDYAILKDDLKKFGDSDSETITKMEEEIEGRIHEIEAEISKIQAPNLKAEKMWEVLNKQAQDLKKDFDQIRKEAQNARAKFQKVKEERGKLFNGCFQKIAQNIDGIYKALTQDGSAQAILDVEDMEEPYLGGISYHCVAPGKRFQSMSNLSGGEKTLAALALLFAIQSVEPSPFLILDEIDAALDNTNISKVARYLKNMTKDMQIIVISLKVDLYHNVDALVGVTTAIREETDVCLRSAVYTLDLTPYLA